MHDLLLSLTYHGKLLKFQMFSAKTRNIIKLPNLKACGGTTFSIKDSAVSRKRQAIIFLILVKISEKHDGIEDK